MTRATYRGICREIGHRKICGYSSWTFVLSRRTPHDGEKPWILRQLWSLGLPDQGRPTAAIGTIPHSGSETEPCSQVTNESDPLPRTTPPSRHGCQSKRNVHKLATQEGCPRLALSPEARCGHLLGLRFLSSIACGLRAASCYGEYVGRLPIPTVAAVQEFCLGGRLSS